MRHPNYAVVAGEIAILPLAFGEIAVAIVFSILNGFALVWRVRRENEALADRRRLADGDVGIEATNG
jgi:methyltransferase